MFLTLSSFSETVLFNFSQWFCVNQFKPILCQFEFNYFIPYLLCLQVGLMTYYFLFLLIAFCLLSSSSHQPFLSSWWLVEFFPTEDQQELADALRALRIYSKTINFAKRAAWRPYWNNPWGEKMCLMTLWMYDTSRGNNARHNLIKQLKF